LGFTDRNGKEKIMDQVCEALRLLKRREALKGAMRAASGIRVTQERELYRIREELRAYPLATVAVLETAKRLHRPIEALSIEHVVA
jgi:glutamate synthase domain-containing protein 1